MKKTLVLTVAFGMVLLAQADTATMKTGVGGAAPSSAADYLLADNWVGGVIGNADNRKATIANGAVYFTFGAPVTVGSLTGGNAILVSDEKLTVGSYDGASFPKLEYASLYCPVHLTKYSELGWSTVFCGDVRADNTLRFVGEASFRADRYANDTNPVRVNPWSTGEYLQASCDFVFYAPRQSEAVSGTWRLVKGSPFASRAGDEHALAVGTSVTGEGIAEGTFLKRVFPDGSIELSKAATDDVVSSGLQFAAFHPVLRQTVGRWRAFGADGRLQARQHGANDGLEIVVEEVVDATVSRSIDVPATSGCYPGMVVIRNGADNKGRIKFGRAHVAFDAAGAGKTPGFPNAPTQQLDANADTRFTVTNGLSAVLGDFSNAIGTLTKDGAGALEVNLTDAAATKLGAFVVEEGTLTLNLPAGVRYAVTRVSVAAGATLVVSGAGFAADAVELEPGAKIVGPGTLNVPTLAAELALSATLANVTFENGASVDFAGKSDAPVYDVPTSVTADELGDPALWLDIRAAGSVVTAADGTSVERWNDRRGEGHMFATNLVACPELVKAADGTPLHVYLERRTTSASAADQPILVWSKRLTDIRAVFVVKNCREGGGSLVGSFQDMRWLRAPGNSYGAALFNSPTAYPEIASGTFYLNGEVRDQSRGYGYPGGEPATAAEDLKPVLAEFVTSGAGVGDNFAFHAGGAAASVRSGDQRIYEALVYTNELTNLQRVKIEKYLMDKWIDRGYSPADVSVSAPNVASAVEAADAVALGVAAGKDVVVKSVTGEGTLVKGGEGTLHVEDYDHPDGALVVASGSVVLRSRSAEADALPGVPAFHVDASDAATCVTNASGTVTSWADIRPSEARVAKPITGCWGAAKLVADACGGLPAVSFGDATSYPSYANKSPELKFDRIDGVRSLLTVMKMDTSDSNGGVVLGNAEEDKTHYTDGVYYGLRRMNYQSKWNNAFIHDAPYRRPDTSVNKYMYGIACDGPGATYFRTNGVEAVLQTTKPTGSYQLLAFSAVEGVSASGFTQSHFSGTTYFYGGNAVAESILYTNALSRADLLQAEACLNKKWFGVSTPGYRPARAGRVDVSEGATLELVGGAPAEVSALYGSGTVDGSVTVRDGGSLGVTVLEDGSVVELGVTGALALAGDGTLVLTGSVRKIKAGSWLLATNATKSGTWTVDSSAAPGLRKTCRVRLADGNLYLDVQAPGLMMLVR